MIKSSFIFLEKISTKKEQSIWKQGVRDWHDFLKNNNIKGISSVRKSYYDRKIKEAQAALQNDNSSYFIGKIPLKETWRLYNYFKEECCFLDIEVDSSGRIVLVGMSNYYNTNYFVKGVNLEKSILEKELSKYKLIITFNGSSFDLPKLHREIDVKITLPHIDLKPLCVNLKLHGGLKEIEKLLDLKRPSHLYGNPVDLWKAFHASRDKEYLELLLEYNREDCENLKQITDLIYKKMSNKLYKHLNLP